MRAITIQQPWASLIVCGIKDVENRSWKTPPGEILVHAGKRIDLCAMDQFGHLLDDAPTGALIGSVRITETVTDSSSEWAMPDCWHWLLADAKECDPIPMLGRQGIWTPDLCVP